MSREYIIDNSEWDSREPSETVRMTNSELPEGMEILDTPTNAEQVRRDIEEAARQEGLVSNGLVGGENATPEEVIKALTEEEMPEGAKENKRQYEDQKIEEFKEVTATRDLLFQRLKKPVKLYIQIGKDKEGTPVKLTFKARKLSESENNHIVNHHLIGKPINELTKSEYDESMRFRRKTLSRAIIEPALTEQEWGEEVENAIVIQLFEELQDKVLNGISDSEIFQ